MITIADLTSEELWLQRAIITENKAYVKKQEQLDALFNIIKNSKPGTEFQFTIDVPLTQKETIYFKREEI